MSISNYPDEERISDLERKLNAYVNERRARIDALRTEIRELKRECAYANNAWDAEEPWKLTGILTADEIALLSQYKGYGMYGDPVRQ